MDPATLKEAGQLGALGFLGIGFLWLILKTIPGMIKTHADSIGVLLATFKSDQKEERDTRSKENAAHMAALERNTRSNEALSAKLEGFCKAR